MNMNMSIHRYNAECDLLLKTRDKKLRNYYWRLRNIASIIPVKFKLDDDKWNFCWEAPLQILKFFIEILSSVFNNLNLT